MTSPNPDRRSERARQAILSQALELCRERGLAKTTMDDIARRAGVGKQTIYRWWPSKAAVLLEALNERIGGETDFPDTGDVVADLKTQMTAVAKLFASTEFAPYRGLIAAAQDDPDVATSVVASMIAPRVEACRQRLARAQEQRQVRADVDLADVVELLYAPLYYRLLLRTRPVTPEMAATMVELAFAGLRPPAHPPR